MKKFFYFFLTGLIAAFILFLRNPQFLLHAQFWAEDGHVWFAQAYNFGWFRPLFWAQDGYFQTVSRLAADIALLFPIVKAPLVINIFTVILQIIPVLFLASDRLSEIIPNRLVRLFIALGFLFLPNSSEIRGSLTYVQWFLALSAFLVIVANLPNSKFKKVFDSLILFLCGVSGPYIVFLVPVSFIIWWRNRRPYRLYIFLLTILGAAIQSVALFILSSRGQVHLFSAMSPKLFMAILNRQVFMGSIIGQSGYLWILNNISWYFWLFLITTALSLVLVSWSIYKGNMALRLFLLFGFLIFSISLMNSTANAAQDMPAWKVLSRSIDGVRYWFLPMLAFFVSVVWNVRIKNPLLIRIIAGVYLIAFLWGAIGDFKSPMLTDYKFSNYSENFSNLPSGRTLKIPINPPGWEMELVKK